LHEEFVRTLTLAGVNDVAALSGRHVRRRAGAAAHTA
jgi:hypothetical protein